MIVGMLAMAGCPASADDVVVDFDGEHLPSNMKQHHAAARIVPFEGRRAMQVDFAVVDWPNVLFTPPHDVWDWSDYAGLKVALYNPTDVSVSVCIRVDNDGADGANHCNTASTCVPPREHVSFECRFNTGDDDTLWGMRGVPVRGPVPTGSILDTGRIVAFQVFLPRPSDPHTLILQEVRLFGQGGPLGERVPMPFVDRFGQYKHSDWPGKLHKESDFAQRRAAEERERAARAAVPGRDRFGGWADGPQREATGWFRTEAIDGVWWLVTPDGHLFFSNGVDCVGTWERTWVTGRDTWFEWLPKRDDPTYGPLFSEQSGAHSMADPIGGAGTTFTFYGANLIRKYGDAWADRWRESVYQRLPAWGFNTIANWSQGDVLENSPMPFVGSLGCWGDVREIEGAQGYWGRMKDVYDSSFRECVDASVAAGTAKYRDTPLCIGFFFDNELSWETVRRGVLESPPDQPARIAFIDWLKAKYDTIETLNRAWATDAADWESLRAPTEENEACRNDLDELEYAFDHRYFDIVNAAFRAHAPHQLYLGCRFSSTPANAVRACADVADVLSFNRYERRIKCTDYTDLGKPVMIGEFHFGARDRGMFHTGLVPTEDQAERAQCYAEYVGAVADCPAFVGCHWFQYIDEPITGRWFDGENYNIGFLDVTDTPYPELVEAARQIHGEVYTRHAAAK
ncbi:MAG TPA: beta-galactosidase [Candidatus Hydrogenedentes bacterium]|nr:beta-galactosidase [Candidatus Hydrogenedentota bacterium]